MHAYTELLAAANSELLAMRPQSLRAFLASAKSGEQAARPTKLPKVQGKIAIIPIHGMIVQRPSIWGDLFGCTSTMQFDATFSRAMNEPQIGAVLFDVESPGGTTSGVEISSDRVYSARGIKPIVAVANSMACSAAYWIGSSAEHFYAVPGAGSIGSIGCYRVHEDISQALEREGINVTLIYQPARKVEGNPFEPLSAEAKEFQQQQVDRTYKTFKDTVSRNRKGKLVDTGDGRDFHAEQAKEMGLIDRIATMEDIIAELTRGAKGDDVPQSRAEKLTQALCESWTSGVVDGKPKATGVTVKRRRELLGKRMAW